MKLGTRTFHFAAWKDHESFYLLPASKNQHRRVVELKYPCPEGFGLLEGGPTPFNYPRKEPVKIYPYRLLPPPCFKDREEAAASTISGEVPYCMTLTPEDDRPLMELMEALRSPKIQELKEDLKNCPDGPGYEKVKEQLEELIQAFEKRVPPFDLESVKAGMWGYETNRPWGESIRDMYLAKYWAKRGYTCTREGFNKRVKIDLVEMDRNRELFRQWLDSWARQPVFVRDISRKRAFETVDSPHFSPNDPRFLRLAKSVRWVIEFNDGTLGYLTDFKERTHLDAAEIDELKKVSKPVKNHAARVRGGKNSGKNRFPEGVKKKAIESYHLHKKKKKGRKFISESEAARLTIDEINWPVEVPTPRSIINWSKR